MQIEKIDPDIHLLIKNEILRQQETINLIPSENLVSRAVMEATGSVLTNKYSEGYPNRRYYQGNADVDTIENIAIARAKEFSGKSLSLSLTFLISLI